MCITTWSTVICLLELSERNSVCVFQDSSMMYCSWRELGVQLQKHIPHWSQNGQFFNNDGQVEPAKIHPSGSAHLIISDAFVI